MLNGHGTRLLYRDLIPLSFMAQLKWHDTPEQMPIRESGASSASNPWFAVTMGLLGVIVGYIIGNF